MKPIDEIRAREQRASEEIARLCAGKPGTNWRWSIPANPERDSDLILADSIADIPKLVSALERIEEYMARLDALTGGRPVDPGLVAHIVRRNITKALEGGAA